MNTTKLIVVALSTLTSVSCRHQGPGQMDQGVGGSGGGSILASIDSIGTPNGITNTDLDFRLYCGTATEGIKGIVSDVAGDKKVSFKPTQAAPIAAAAKCRMKVIGPESDKLNFKDPALTDGRRYYNKTSASKLSAERTLELYSVNRYSLAGSVLFNVNFKIKNSAPVLVESLKGTLHCGGTTISTDIIGGNSFKFDFKLNHFNSSPSLTCNKLTVNSISDDLTAAYVNKEDFSFVVNEGSRSSDRPELEIVAQVPTNNNGGDIGVSLVGFLNGSFVSDCYEVNLQNDTTGYQTESYEFIISEGANIGSINNTFNLYSDDKCKEAMISEPTVVPYKFEILDPELASAAPERSLPIRITRIEEGTGNILPVTDTIVNVTDSVLRFGTKKTSTGEDAFWTGNGSDQETPLPTELFNREFKKITPEAQ